MAGHTKKKKRGIQLQEKILLVTTFLIGMVAGWYLYITAFAPQFNEFMGNTVAIYEDLVLIGDQYGGIRVGSAPSFQVLKDGSYNYVTNSDTSESEQHHSGTLPSGLWSEVRSVLTTTRLTELARPLSAGNCASMADGIDYKYEITLQSVPYTLDTCSTYLAHDTVAKAALLKLWDYFETHP